MSSPNASIFEEISEQNLDDLGVGSAAQPAWTQSLVITVCLISHTIGNPGYLCTATVECQKNCG